MDFDQIVSQLPVIKEDVNYWMVRTSGGKFYDQFISNKKIAMGSSYISPSELVKIPTKREKFFKVLCPIIQQHTESERPGLTASQFYRFYYEIRKNDIVIIPSESSQFLTIGRVTDDTPGPFSFPSDDTKQGCDHIHTRNVDWLTTKSRHEFNPNFVSLLFSHNAIVDANDYKDYINGVLYDFFIQENTGHLLINIKSKDSIKARTLFYLFFELLDLTEDFFDEPLSVNDINIRINLNSPGKVELISKNLFKLSLVGMIIVAVAGGHFKFRDMQVGTEGVLKPLLAFINEQDERRARIELINGALDDLKVTEPKELARIIQEARIAKK